MRNSHIWIRAERDQAYGLIHLMRAQALAEAAVREAVEQVTLILNREDAGVLESSLPDSVKVAVMERLTPQQEAAAIVEMFKPHVPKRVDSRNPRPLVYLLGNQYEEGYQRFLWKAGCELAVVSDEAMGTWADWFILPRPYAQELTIDSRTGYTRFLLGAQYTPLRIDSMRAIYKHTDHNTVASRIGIATENLDAAWLPKIVKALQSLEPPVEVGKSWKPILVLLPGLQGSSAEELKAQLGDTKGIGVEIADEGLTHIEQLLKLDILFSANNTTLEEAIALGIVRGVLPRKGESISSDLMANHMMRREATMKIPEFDDPRGDQLLKESLERACFDPSWRRGQNRIGQYLCDGIGSIRIIRQTAFKVYEVPQNLVRYFESADPLLAKV